MRVTSIQLGRNDWTKQEAVDHALVLLDKAPPSDLLILPEIWATGFFCFDRYQSEAEPVDGALVQTFKAKAAGLGCHILMGSFIEKNQNGLFNTCLLLDPSGSVIAKYSKIHLFGFESQERDMLTPGKGVTVADTPWGKAGLATCYDLRFPEQFRKMIDLGAQFFLIVSAWPLVRLEAWTLFNRARAHENLSFLISCNCAGTDAGSAYAGNSMIIDPLGQVLAQGDEKEDIITAEIDLDQVSSVRKYFSALHDRVEIN